MFDELEKFLRQAAAKRQANQQPAQPQRPPMAAEVVEPEIVVYDDIEIGEDVADHVSHHMDTGQFSDRASHMAEQVGQADEKVEARLHEKFDHDIGTLKDTSEGAEEFSHDKDQSKPVQPSMAPSDILQFFRQPQNVRRAIIMSEILRRPERW